MYSAPDFVKVAVKVEESFADYESKCQLIVGKNMVQGTCDQEGYFSLETDVYPAGYEYICYSGELGA